MKEIEPSRSAWIMKRRLFAEVIKRRDAFLMEWERIHG
jgi:hypothetical protein